MQTDISQIASFLAKLIHALKQYLPEEYAYGSTLTSNELRRYLLQLDRFFSTSLFTAPLLVEGSTDIISELLSSQDDCEPLSSFALALEYEKAASETRDRKREAIFYTPEEIANFVATKLLDQIETPSPHTLDPACGGGILLLALAKKLLSNNDTEWKKNIALLEETIYGIDRDPHAAEVTRLLLILLAAERSEQPAYINSSDALLYNLRIGNSLLQPEEDLQHSVPTFSVKKAFSAQRSRENFDIVVANPPYGLSRDNQISEEESILLKKRYSYMLRGKPNKYMLFIARGRELLAEKGRLSMIVPNSWLGIKSGSSLRKLFLEEDSLRSLYLFEEPIFTEPGVEAVIFSVSRAGADQHIAIEKYISSDYLESSYQLPVKECMQLHDNVIPLHWSPSIANVFQTLRQQSSPLHERSTLEPLIALQAYATGKGTPVQSKEDVKQHIYHSDQKIDDSYLPYLQGKDVRRYTVSWSGQYLRYGECLAEPQPLERYTGPRIIVREILGDLPYLIQATYTDEPYLYNKSLLHILGERDELLALLSVLNSHIGSCIIHSIGKKSARKLFPKLVLDDLKHFPLPNRFDHYREQLKDLALKKIESPATIQDEEIDEIVSEAYSLGKEERKTIRKITKNQKSTAS